MADIDYGSHEPAIDYGSHQTIQPIQEPSILSQAAHNLPGSLKRLVEMTPGVPHAQTPTPAGTPTETMRNPITGASTEVIPAQHASLSDSWEAAKAAGVHVLDSFARFVEDPKGTIQEAFAKDPAGTVALPVQLVRGLYEAASSAPVKTAIAKVSDASPLARSALGVVSPRGMHAADFVNNLRKAFGKEPVEAPPAVTPTGTGSPTADASVQQIVPQVEEMPPAPAARPFIAPAQPSMKLLDDIARGTSGKPFGELSAERQDVVRGIAAKFAKPNVQLPANGQPTSAGAMPMQPASAVPAPAAPAQPVTPIEATPQPVLPKQPVAIDTGRPVEPVAAQAALQAHPPFAENAPFSPSKAARQQTAAPTAADVHSQVTGMAKMFKDAGIAAKDLEKAPFDQWNGSAEIGGFPKTTQEIRTKVLDQLRKLERAAPIAKELADSLAQ